MFLFFQEKDVRIIIGLFKESTAARIFCGVSIWLLWSFNIKYLKETSKLQ